MRTFSFLLMICVTIGCGSGNRRSNGGDPRPGFGFMVPSITALMPQSSPVNSLPFTMTIQGSDFATDATVFWNGIPQHTTFLSPSQLLVSVTDTDLMFTGPAHIAVHTQGLNSNTVDFSVTPQ